MHLPTWLYCKDGSSEIVKDEITFNKLILDGWQDTPDKFKVEQKQEPVKKVKK